MKSYAQVKGHPLHPALIPFPFALLLAALLFDAAGWLAGNIYWTFTGAHVLAAGIVAGLVAAIPGVLDFWMRVPPASSARVRAARHGVANVTAIGLFAAAWWLRRDSGVTGAILAVETIAAGILLYAGWLGGVLVTRNMISVDHRHANAGKWQEGRFTVTSKEPLAVAKADDLEEGQMKLLIVNGHRIALARTPRGFAAFEDACTHRGASLADGVCVGASVQCLWHGSRFDIETGEVMCGPAKRKIKVYAVKRQDGDVVLVSPPH